MNDFIASHGGGADEGSQTSRSDVTTSPPHSSSPTGPGPPSTLSSFNSLDHKDPEIGNKEAAPSNPQTNDPGKEEEIGGPDSLRSSRSSKFTSMTSPSPAYQPSSLEIASSPQKHLKLVPVGSDGRRFRWVEEEKEKKTEEEEELSGTTGSTPSARDNDPRICAKASESLKSNETKEWDTSKGRSNKEVPISNPTIRFISPAKTPSSVGSSFLQCSPRVVRLEKLSQEEKRAFLLSSSAANSISGRSTAKSRMEEGAGASQEMVLSNQDDIRAARVRFSSQLIGEIKQSPQAMLPDWEQPQMSMCKRDVRAWVDGVVLEPPLEENSTGEVYSDEISDLKHHFDSMDVNEEGEPAWIEARAAEQESSSEGSSNNGSSSIGSARSASPIRRLSPSNLSEPLSHGMTAPTTPSNDQKRDGFFSSSSLDSSSKSNKISPSRSPEPPELPTSLRMNMGDSCPNQILPSYSIKSSSCSNSEDGGDEMAGGEESSLVDLTIKAQMLHQVEEM